MRTLSIVVVLETRQLFLQVSWVPKRYAIKILAPDRPDQPFDEWVGHWHIRHCLDLLDFEDPKICFPALKLKERVVIRTQIGGRCCSFDDPAEHQADSRAIDGSPVHGESNDSSCTLVHDDHDPVRTKA